MIRLFRPDLPGMDRLVLEIERHLEALERPRPYTVATLPDATKSEGMIAYVSDEAGGSTLAFASGGQWLRSYDRAVVS